MSKPILYQYAACPFCWKVKVLLALKKVDHEVVEVNPLSSKEIEFSKDWDSVPIYIDSHGKQVNDSTPIMRHIDAEFTEKPVFEKESARVEFERHWLKWSEEYVGAIPPVIYGSFPEALRAFDYLTKVSKFSAGLKGKLSARAMKYSGALAMTLVAKKMKKKKGITDPKAYLAKHVEQWAQALGDKDFLGDKKPNAADAAVYGISMSVANLPAREILVAEPKFAAWIQRMEETSGIRFS